VTNHQRQASANMVERRRSEAEFARLGWHHTSLTQCAVRYAALTGCSCHDAGVVFGIGAGTVYLSWKRIYGTTPPRRPER